MNAFETVIGVTPTSAAICFRVTRIVYNVKEMRSRFPVLVLLCMAQFVDVLDVNASVVALPLIARDFGLAESELQWVVTAYVLVFAGCLLVSGRLADTYGRRRVFALGHGRLHGGVAGVRARARRRSAGRRARLQGLGAALTAPAALALLVDAFPGDRRAVAVWTGVAAVGGASGLVFGGLIADTLGWRWVFLINVPIGVVALALTPRLLRESRTGRRAAGPARGRGGDRRARAARRRALRLAGGARGRRAAARASSSAREPLPLLIRDRTVAARRRRRRAC